MRITFEKGKGVLHCVTGKYEPVKIEFPRETLLDWYPLCVNYEYRYNINSSILYLVPIELENVVDYGIIKRKGRAHSSVASFKVGEWFNQEVYDQNVALLKVGSTIGLPKYGSKLTKEDIETSHSIVTKKLEDPILTNLMDKVKSKLTPDGIERLHRKTEDEVANDLYKEATQEDLDQLYITGQLRVYLNLLRKEIM